MCVYLSSILEASSDISRAVPYHVRSSSVHRSQPKKGSALVFFPSAGGIPNTPLDIRTLHCGESVAETSNQDKWISQLWLREKANAYKPTAPKGNAHDAAVDAISEYCTSR